MAFLKGTTLSLVATHGPLKVEWKQGSFLGFGGDMAEYYEVCDYTANSSEKIRVFVHKAKGSPPRTMKVDSSMQYGMNDGIFFIVVHDKKKYTPFQHRFICNDTQKVLYFGAEVLKKMKGVDVTWMAGDYLRDF